MVLARAPLPEIYPLGRRGESGADGWRRPETPHSRAVGKAAGKRCGSATPAARGPHHRGWRDTTPERPTGTSRASKGSRQFTRGAGIVG